MNNLNKMIIKLGNIIDSNIIGHITIIGIRSGGEYMSKDISNYLEEKGRVTQSFNISVNKEKEVITEGKEFIKKSKYHICFHR